MTNVFRGCGAVFYKEVLHVRRDFATLFFSLIIPILQMTLLGYGIVYLILYPVGVMVMAVV